MIVARLLAQRDHVVLGEVDGRDRVEHPDLGPAVPEPPVVFDERIAGAEHGERQDRDARLDRQPKRTVAELAEFARLGPRALREDHHRDLLVEPVTTVLECLGSRLLVAAFESDVACQPHRPADERDLEEFALRHPLHLEREVGDQEDVDEALVIGDRDVGMTRVVGDHARHAELPERVELLVDDGDLPEEETCVVVRRVERGGHQTNDRHHGHDDEQGHPQDEPGPDAQDRAGRS